MTDTSQTQLPERQHKATFARDKWEGGYNIRVIGPNARKFAGRRVPVTRKDDSETMVTLESLIWSGKDDDTGRPVALYSFVPEEKKHDNVEF